MSDPVNTGPRWPTIPEPGTDPSIMLSSVIRLKEAMELLTGQRGFDQSYSVDYRIDTMQKTLDFQSATFSEKIQLSVNQYGALAERTTLIEAEILAARDGEPSLNARIVSVDTASVDRDGALAQSVDIVQARVDDVSAGGFFKTTAAVSGGALASMEAQVYTTDAFNVTNTAGWRVKIEGGVSYFDVYTSRWRLIDTDGTPKTVMTYSAGKFLFTGEVAINGNLVVVGTIDNPQLAALAVDYPKIYPKSATQGAAVTSVSVPATASMSLRAGATVAVLVSVDEFNVTGVAGIIRRKSLTINGGSVFLIDLPAKEYPNIYNDGVLSSNQYYTTPFTFLYSYVAGYTGTHDFVLSTYAAVGGAEVSVPKYMIIIELAK